MKKIVLILSCVMFLVKCAHVNSVSLTQVPSDRKQSVSVETHKWIFLGFSFDNDFVDELSKKLKQKCKGGKIQGILTKDETYSYFIVFKKNITATGYCIKG